MYLDGVVILSLVIVLLTCAIVIYVGIYAYKHIQTDMTEADAHDELDK